MFYVQPTWKGKKKKESERKKKRNCTRKKTEICNANWQKRKHNWPFEWKLCLLSMDVLLFFFSELKGSSSFLNCTKFWNYQCFRKKYILSKMYAFKINFRKNKCELQSMIFFNRSKIDFLELQICESKIQFTPSSSFWVMLKNYSHWNLFLQQL